MLICSKCQSNNIYKDYENGEHVLACRMCGERDYYGNKFTGESEEEMKKSICVNCGRELVTNQCGGLCGYCEKTKLAGMAHGYSAIEALAVAKQLVEAGIGRGKRIVYPWDEKNKLIHIEKPLKKQDDRCDCSCDATKESVETLLKNESEILEMLRRRMKKNRRSYLLDEVLAILDAQVVADKEEAA